MDFIKRGALCVADGAMYRCAPDSECNLGTKICDPRSPQATEESVE